MKRALKGLTVFMLLLLIIGMMPVSAMAEDTPSVSYCTHVQNVGWVDYADQGEMSGTEGQGLRLEGIRIALENTGYDLGIEYQTHIQNIGWEADTDKGWSISNDFSGTEGLGYRLEAIQIKLSGDDADQFDIYYQVHAQNMGWLGLAKNGESAGTAGYGYRLEGIRIAIVPVGTAAPSWSVTKQEAFYENPASLYPSIEIELQTYEWKDGRYGSRQLYYFYQDLTDDGIPELIIGYPQAPNVYSKYPYSGEVNHGIAFVFQLKNGTPVRVLGRDANIRGYYHLDNNNFIIDDGSGGAYYHGWSYYKINDYNLEFIESVHLDTLNGEEYALRKENEELIKYLTKTEAYEIFDKYSIKQDIDWTPLVF